MIIEGNTESAPSNEMKVDAIALTRLEPIQKQRHKYPRKENVFIATLGSAIFAVLGS